MGAPSVAPTTLSVISMLKFLDVGGRVVALRIYKNGSGVDSSEWHVSVVHSSRNKGGLMRSKMELGRKDITGSHTVAEESSIHATPGGSNSIKLVCLLWA